MSIDKTDPIRSYCIDFNWYRDETKGNVCAPPGTYAESNPRDHFEWYKELECNVIQTFCVALNGYSWYRGGVVPEQPGMKYDYTPEMVRLGHSEGMKVFGYFTLGANPLWARKEPDQCYPLVEGSVSGSGYHIVYSDVYLEYLSTSIQDSVSKTGIDGFMVDWFWQPKRESNGGIWIDAERELFKQLMGYSFPGETGLKAEEETTFGRKALERAWKVIVESAKSVNPDCLIWLTVNKIDHPHVMGSEIYRECDWLMNEAGDMTGIRKVQGLVGHHTRLITCMAAWTGVDATDEVPQALEDGVGLYGFSDPKNKTVKDLRDLLKKPISQLRGDERNIATLARAYRGQELK